MREEKSQRYSRQELLKEVGKQGQERLQKRCVALVGLGALGSVAAELLIRAGIGRLIMVDRDIVEESNLQRQLLYTEKDLGRSKALAAKEHLREINAACDVKEHAIHLNWKNLSLLEKADVILDCTDSLQTRFLLNDFCKKKNLPLIYGAAIKTAGYVFPVLPDNACLQCFLKEANLETCDTVGVLNTITASIAAQQVTLALKVLLGEKVFPELHYTDLWNQEFKKLQVKRNLECKACGGEFVFLERKEEIKTVKFCGSGKFQVQGKEVDLKEIKKRWQGLGDVIEEGEALSFRNILLFKDGRALIKAESEEEALSAYSKWVGN